MKQVNIAVFVSGGGTNLQALIDSEKNGVLKSGKIKLVVSSQPGAYALERAQVRHLRHSWKEISKSMILT